MIPALRAVAVTDGEGSLVQLHGDTARVARYFGRAADRKYSETDVEHLDVAG
jgi:hypothetical protein